MADLETSTPQNPDLADWPLWRSASGKNGSVVYSDERPLSGIGIQ